MQKQAITFGGSKITAKFQLS